MVVFINYETKEKIIIVNDSVKLREFYDDNKDAIFIGYNSRMYDQFIFKGILFGIDPYYINDQIINKNKKGYQVIKNMNEFPLNNFDISNKFRGLKELEGFMGSDIRETTVPFDINRKLTNDELNDVIKYCVHDVEETLKVLESSKEEFDSQLLLLEAFDLPMELFNMTKAQLSAHILGAVKQERLDDEFDLSIPDTLVISDKYKHIVEWYKNPINMSYGEHMNPKRANKLETEVAGVPHIFGFGGIHGAIPNYYDEGIILCADVALTKWGN